LAKRETVDELVSSGRIEPIIVVGIDNAGRRLRPREYLPYPDDTRSPPEPDPQGKLYPLFLLNEVIPFVEARYRGT
jgi:enterochelin esterase-like enzyme